jgi:dolichyl-phosphate-mannose-protein mannosyltransferase
LQAREQAPAGDVISPRLVSLVLLGCWWGGLLVAVPCYSPYPRLALPWLLALWLATSLNARPALVQDEAFSAGRLSVQQMIAAAAVVGVLFVIGLFVGRQAQVNAAADRRGMQQIAATIRATMLDTQPRVVYVYGEPAMFFQLRAAGEEFVAPVQHLPSEAATIEGAPVATYLVVGPHAETDPRFGEQWEGARQRWDLVQALDYQPSAVVWLDLHDPRKALEPSLMHEVRLYKLERK